MRAALIGSVLANLVLALLWLKAPPPSPGVDQPALAEAEGVAPPTTVKTNLVVRRINFTWSQIETNDYRAYIANLRSIGCPDATIRDIIVADVNALYERKRLTEIVTPEQQWWRSNPDATVAQAAMQQAHEMELEKRALLDELLGPNWERSNNWEAVAFNSRFDGPILGSLSAETKDSLKSIEMQGRQKRVDYITARQRAGEPVDSSELKRLADETRAELGKTLNPVQLEEYLLRYSETAQDLRRELQGFEVSPDEFRKIFKAEDELGQLGGSSLAGSDPVSRQHQLDLVNQKEASLEEALGAERYQLFAYNRDPIFREAKTTAQELGMEAELVVPIFQINQAVAQERQRILSDPNLSVAEQAAAMAVAVEEQQQSLRLVLGDQVYEKYRKKTAAP